MSVTIVLFKSARRNLQHLEKQFLSRIKNHLKEKWFLSRGKIDEYNDNFSLIIIMKFNIKKSD